MNIVDIAIILFFIAALIRGTEMGLVRQICSTIGLFAGLFLGVFIQAKFVHIMHTPTSRAAFVLLVVIASIAIVSSIGEYVGSLLKEHIEQTTVRIVNTLDKIIGSCVSGATLLMVVWIGAAIFNNTPTFGLQRQIRSSVIIAELNRSLPPSPNIVARLGRLINPNDFPNVFTGLEPSINTNKPLPSIGDLDTAVQKSRASVIKIEGDGCGGITEGSGFVAADDEVITNAHVVAGVQQPYIIDGAGRHKARVVAFDPDLDMAILRAPNLAGQPLHMDLALAANGTSAAILGYPGGGDFSAKPAIILSAFEATGRNIYNQGATDRQVYSIKGDVIPGNSGGPLVDTKGDVVGVIFAKSTAYDSVGYALTIRKVSDEFSQLKNNTASLDTGSCAE